MHVDAAPYVPLISRTEQQPTFALRPTAPPFFVAPSQPLIALKPVLCKYYPTPTGCPHGQACHFMHEKEGDVSIKNAKPGDWAKRQARERSVLMQRAGGVKPVTPEELVTKIEELKMEAKGLSASNEHVVKDVACKFWKAGYCSRATDCWYAHSSPDKIETTDSEGNDPHRPPCGVCYDDEVKTFGLLKNCSHPFCLKCLHGWRTRTGKSEEVNANMQNVTKCCPVCRQSSPFVTPSSLFHPNGKRKTEIINDYKKVLREIPCRYFKLSLKKNKKRQDAFCPFGDECHYSHMYRGKKIVLHATAAQNMPKLKGRRLFQSQPGRRESFTLDDDILGDIGHIDPLGLRALASALGMGRQFTEPDDFVLSAADIDSAEDEEQPFIMDVLGPNGQSITRPAPAVRDSWDSPLSDDDDEGPDSSYGSEFRF